MSSGGAPTPAGTSVFSKKFAHMKCVVKHNGNMGMRHLWLSGWESLTLGSLAHSKSKLTKSVTATLKQHICEEAARSTWQLPLCVFTSAVLLASLQSQLYMLWQMVEQKKQENVVTRKMMETEERMAALERALEVQVGSILCTVRYMCNYCHGETLTHHTYM